MTTSDGAPKVRVGRLIKERRAERGESAAAAGRAIGVSQQRIAQWESGAGRPPVERADALADYLGRPLAEILLLIHADHTDRAGVDPTLTQTLDAIEQTLEKLMLQQQHLAERLELVAEPPKDVDGC